MATYTATTVSRPVVAEGNARSIHVATGAIELTTALAATDIITLCRVPKGAVIVGGRLRGDKLASGATAASESLTIAIGIDQAATLWDGTAVGSGSMVNALMSTQILSGIAVGTIKPETGYDMPLGGLLITSAPFLVGADANVNVVIQASAGAGSFISGSLNIEVEYYMGQHT